MLVVVLPCLALPCSEAAIKPVQQVMRTLLHSSGALYGIMLAKLVQPTQLTGSHHSNSTTGGPPPLHELPSFAISMRMAPSLVSSTMYTTAMQQLEGTRPLEDWQPVDKVGA